MAGPSVYVHSNADHVSNWSVSTDLVSNMSSMGGIEGELYVNATVRKLEAVRDQLESEAQRFLQGYSTEDAQHIAENADELLVQLASRVLYGSNGGHLVGALRQNKTLKVKELRSYIEKQGINDFSKKVLANLQENVSVSEAATILAQALSEGETKITVTEAGSHIEKLGGLFNVSRFESTVRGQVVPAITKEVFKSTRPLVTHQGGVYRKAIRDLISSSQFVDSQSLITVVKDFCDELGKQMKSIAPSQIPFLLGTETIESIIDKFIGNLKPALFKTLKQSNTNITDKSNVGGAIGEEVRSTISQVAKDSVLISFTMGSLTEDKAVNQINQALQKQGSTEQISKMVSYHPEDKQSLTDLVLLNTKTKAIARAQSKNHIVSYFLEDENGNKNNEIENFRWKIADNLNLLTFISNLSKTELGMSLNDVDMSNLSYAMANNLWFKYHKSATPDNSVPYHGKIEFSEVSVPDFQTELEGSLERLLAGQITNFLGITLSNSINPKVVMGGSNIFYLLNGRFKKTSELIQQAIDQLKESQQNLKLNKDSSRMINVSLQTQGAKNVSPGKGENSFLIKKLHAREEEGIGPGASAASIGEEMGEEILRNLKIKVSLGTSISTLQTTSYMF